MGKGSAYYAGKEMQEELKRIFDREYKYLVALVGTNLVTNSVSFSACLHQILLIRVPLPDSPILAPLPENCIGH